MVKIVTLAKFLLISRASLMLSPALGSKESSQVNHYTLETEAGGSGVQGHYWLQSKFEINLDYMRPNLNKPKKKKWQGSSGACI